MTYLEECPRCEGRGVLQTGSLAGNECSQCIGGQVLSDDGKMLYELMLAYHRRGDSCD